MIFPQHFEQKIEFDKIKQLIQGHCVGAHAKELIADLRFSTQQAEILEKASQTNEFCTICREEGDAFPTEGYFDTRVYLKRIATEGTYLTETELFELYRSLLTVKRIVQFFSVKTEEEYPFLKQKCAEVDAFPEICRYIDTILDKFGRIKDHASDTLAQIRRQKITLTASISKLMASIIRQAQQDGYLEKDVTPSLRDGRLVIPIAPAFKRKLGGIVHDESATGKTVYVEPGAVVEANNQIRELEAEEKREMIKILMACSDFMRPYLPQLGLSMLFLAEMDALRAQALFAIRIGATLPQSANKPLLDWKSATHPLLFLSLQEQHKEIVPLDIALDNEKRILIISGPNAGGKSVCLKTVGLLQYMWQCGLLVPMMAQSTMGIFEHIFIDIGDEQSLENDLSTYSSHLSNMKFFLRNGNGRTLLLIDEFGSGTEPQIGGAIAQAELERFNQQKCFGVINTHYTNLKHFASQTPGLVNGAMLYDRHHLQALYQLSIGNPGSSFAIEIARKIGLPEDVIEKASNIVGNQHIDYDKNLQDIVRDKRYWENKRQQVKLKEKKMNEADKNLQEQLSGIEKQRKEIIRQAKAEAKQLLSEANATIEKTIKEIKEAKADKEKTKAIRQQIEQQKKALQEEKKSKPMPQKQAPVAHDALAVGDAVAYGENVGEILEIKGKKAVVAMGLMKLNVPLEELSKANRKQIRQQEQRSQTPTWGKGDNTLREHQLKFKTQIDVRGMRADEALQTIMYYIDDAIMMGVSTVRILHGTGTGALKQTIRQYLYTVPQVRSAKDEHVQLGGAGITVVEFG
jgi:DNA mismatch repair protein MutS2